MLPVEGYFLPPLFLPLYAQAALPSQPSLGSLSLALINGAALLSRLGFGALSDSPHLGYVLVLSSSVGSGLSVLLLWGLAGADRGALLGFCVAFGVFAGGFSSLWSGMIRSIGSRSLLSLSSSRLLNESDADSPSSELPLSGFDHVRDLQLRSRPRQRPHRPRPFPHPHPSLPPSPPAWAS